MISTNTKHRPFLKWAGGKYKTLDFLTEYFPPSDIFIEPFVGAGSVFLNTNYKHYILNDINSDLINLYKIIQKDPKSYITDVRPFFHPSNNDPDVYYGYREKFNLSTDKYERSLIFFYLNKFGFNGLCRYNKKGMFNVPFGKFKSVRFDADRILYFAQKIQNASLYCLPFEKIFDIAPENSVIYCDPPYAELNQNISFTTYHTNDFFSEDQKMLAERAKEASLSKKSTVIISNHNTPQTREWYSSAKIVGHKVRRLISSQGKRPEVNELIAIYQPK